MTNAVETLEKLERRVTLSIPLDEVEKEVGDRLKKQARTTKAPGFRQGKVPMKMVTAQYGPQIRTDVITAKLFSAFNAVVQEKDLSYAGYPRFEPKKDDVPEGVLLFNALFEVYPEVKLDNLSEIELEKSTTEVTEAQIEETIDRVRKRQAHYHPRGEESEHGNGGPDTSAQNGDQLTIDFLGKINGEEFNGGKAEDYVFTLGEGQMLPEFEEAARGMKKGESKVFNLTFPEDYHGQDVAGKTAEFSITIKQVEWPHYPEVDEAFAKNLGIADGSVEKMRAEIEKNLKMETKNRLNALNKKRAMDALVKAIEFDLPQVMLNQEIDQLIENTRKDMVAQKMNVKDVPFPRELFTEQAERRLRLGLIFAEFLKGDQFKVSDDEIRARAEEIGSTYENPKMIVDYYMNEEKRRKELESLVIEDKIIEHVFANAKTVETTMTFSELMAQRV